MASRSIVNQLIKHAKRKDDPLTPLIDKYLLERGRSDNRYWEVPAPVEDRIRPAGRLSPSSICGCQRLAVFRFLGVNGSKAVEPETEIVFDDGKWRHLRLGWMCRDMEAVLGSEVFHVVGIEESADLEDIYTAGSYDIVVTIYGVPYVIDFKGINQWGFDWLSTHGRPKEEHKHQLITYERLRRIKRGFIWYECKNTGRIMIFPVDWSPKLWREVKEWCQEVIAYLDDERLPKRHPECRDGRYLYGRCRYTRLCYGGKTDAEIERRVFRNFPGKEELWRAGLDEIKNQD